MEKEKEAEKMSLERITRCVFKKNQGDEEEKFDKIMVEIFGRKAKQEDKKYAVDKTQIDA